jgi:AcrR family transcriptional regulator
MRRPGRAKPSVDAHEARARGPSKRRPTAPRARATRPGNLRERLLACTTAIIRKDGLAFVSLRAVARRARVSHGAPAYHFRSKAGLLGAYAQQGYERLTAKVERALKGVEGDPAAELRAVGCAYVEFAIANPEHFAIMFRDELHEQGDAALAAAANRALATLRDTLKRVASRKLIDAGDFDTALAASWAIAHGLASLWLAGRFPKRFGGAEPTKFVERVIAFYVDAIVRPRPG